MKIIPFVAAALLAPAIASAQVYKCPKPDGSMGYQDTPCPNAEVMEIKESFDAGGSGSVVVNKGLVEVHKEKQREAEIESLRREVDALKRENAKPKKKSVSCFTHGVQTRSGKVFSQNTVCR